MKGANTKKGEYSGKGLGGMGSAGGMGGHIREEENIQSTDEPVEKNTAIHDRDNAMLREEQKKRGQYPLHDEPIGGG